MVSGFLTGSGRLRVRDEVTDDELLREGVERDPTVYFQYGDKGEGYWKGEDMVQQVRHVFYSTIHPTMVSLQKMH